MFAGGRKSVRGSRYGMELSIMEHMHWTWQELQGQPADLVDELAARLIGQNRADAKRARMAKLHGRS